MTLTYIIVYIFAKEIDRRRAWKLHRYRVSKTNNKYISSAAIGSRPYLSKMYGTSRKVVSRSWRGNPADLRLDLKRFVVGRLCFVLKEWLGSVQNRRLLKNRVAHEDVSTNNKNETKYYTFYRIWIWQQNIKIICQLPRSVFAYDQQLFLMMCRLLQCTIAKYITCTFSLSFGKFVYLLFYSIKYYNRFQFIYNDQRRINWFFHDYR